MARPTAKVVCAQARHVLRQILTALAHCHHEFHPNHSQIPEGIHNPLAISPSKRSYATPVKKGASGKLQMVKNAKDTTV